MKFLLSLFLILCFSLSAEAQADELKKLLEDQMAKSQQNGNQSDEADAAAQAALLSSMFGNKEDLNLREQYTFDFQIDWRVENSKEKEASEFKQFFSKEGNYVSMEGESIKKRNKEKEVSMVIDMDNNYMIMLNKKDKQAIVMSTGSHGEDITQMEENNTSNEVSITKTGKTKIIASYTVEQYLYKSDDGHGELWTTKDLKFQKGNFFSYFQNKNNDKQNDWWNNQVEGYLLETKGISNDGDTFHMLATSVNKNANVKHVISEYQVINMTGVNNFMNKE